MAQEVLEGEVRGLRERTENIKHKVTNEQYQEIVWTFQLVRYQDGQALDPVPVELRGETINGVLNEGNIVRLVQGSWRAGQTFQAREVFNVTLNSPVIAKPPDFTWRIIIAIFIVLAFLAFA